MRRAQAVFCRICGIFIDSRTASVAENLCQSHLCRRWDANNIAASKAREHAETLEQRRHDLLDISREQSFRLKPELSHEKSLKIVVLPFLEHNLTKPSTERRREFTESLLSLASTAYAQNSEAEQHVPAFELEVTDDIKADQNSAEGELDPRFTSLSGTACGTCGGKCCNWGRDGAFLTVDKFREVLRNRPTSSPEEVVAEYMARVPDLTYHESCIFHGAQGCGLTRELRAFTCNAYLCVSLHELRDGIDAGASSFLFAATNFRDVEAAELSVLRLKVSGENGEQTLLEERCE